MTNARPLIYFGLAISIFIALLWYGYLIFTVVSAVQKENLKFTDLLSKLKNSNLIIWAYPILLLILLGRMLIMKVGSYLSILWPFAACIISLWGILLCFLGWFAVAVSVGPVGLTLFIVPLVLASAVLPCLLFVNSPISVKGIWMNNHFISVWRGGK